MNKKFIFGIIVAILLLVPLASAFSLTGFFKSIFGITGKAVEETSITLQEGTEQKVTIGSTEHTLLLDAARGTTAYLVVDGVRKTCSEGSSYSFPNLVIYVKTVYPSVVAGELSWVELSLVYLVTVYLEEGEEQTVTVGGIDHIISLSNISSALIATIVVDGIAKEVSNGSIYVINNLQVTAYLSVGINVVRLELTSTTLAKATCTEEWTCTSWSACANGQQTRSCTDKNNCGTTISKPAATQSCKCTEEWTCTSWSACANGQQTRSCTDKNNCGTTVNKPTTVQTCCVDNDGDGYGQNCAKGNDCNDNDASINPEATEICDGKDNDCDGQTDENCECTPQWECKITPLLCPLSGKQTKTCKDVKCNAEPTEESITCIPEQCSGCLHGTTCVPFGQRLKVDKISSYCSVDSVFRPQMPDGATCENDYECLSNECSNGKCISTYTLLEKIFEFFKAIFGKGWLWSKA